MAKRNSWVREISRNARRRDECRGIGIQIWTNDFIPANFFWDVGVRFLKTTLSFPKIPEEVRSLPKTSEVCRRRSYRENAYPQNQIARKVLSFIHFTHGFRSLHGSELTYLWKLCQARRQQLTFFNQVWEIGPQAWAGVREKFSTRRRESWQVYYGFSNSKVSTRQELTVVGLKTELTRNFFSFFSSCSKTLKR